MRPLGDITLDMEVLLNEIIDDHDLQLGEILALIKVWVEIHAPGAIEEYEDGSNPVYYYGHKELKK